MLSLLNKNIRCEMPDFFGLIKDRKKHVFVYPMHEPWLDIGNPRDFELANTRLLVNREAE